MSDRPNCAACALDGRYTEAVALAPMRNEGPTAETIPFNWILLCEAHTDGWEDAPDDYPEYVWLESESYDREDDPEEVKREAERTPCPRCGKLPDVQQHCEGLGVSHRCRKDRLHLGPAKGELIFSGYAPDWIERVKQIKKKAEETCCPQCEKPPRVDADGRLSCTPGVCSNATGSYSHGGWLDYYEDNRDWWDKHPVEAEIRKRGNAHHQGIKDGIAEINRKLDALPDGNGDK